jgi:hypothetical protein
LQGRLYTAFKAFVIFVLMSSYIAQYSGTVQRCCSLARSTGLLATVPSLTPLRARSRLAAIQNSLPQPVQPVSGIQSFGALGKPVCMRQIASQNNWLKTTYPQLNVKPIPGLTQARHCISAHAAHTDAHPLAALCRRGCCAQS